MYSNGSRYHLADDWVITDLRNKTVKASMAAAKGDALNTTGDDALTELHMANWLDAIRTGAKLNLAHRARR